MDNLSGPRRVSVRSVCVPAVMCNIKKRPERTSIRPTGVWASEEESRREGQEGQDDAKRLRIILAQKV